MTNSESLKNLVPALLKAQSEMGKAVKGAENSFFKSDYADLTSVMEVVKEPLNTNGLAILQSVDEEFVRTTLLHTSGEWLQSGGTRIVSAKPNDPQAQGSAITYAKRYDLQALLFVPTTDDDGEKAVDRKPTPKPTKEPVEESQDDLSFSDDVSRNEKVSDFDKMTTKRNATIKRLYAVAGKTLKAKGNSTSVRDYLATTIAKNGYASLATAPVDFIEGLIVKFESA